MDHLEIELKFFVPDFAILRDRLRAMGAVCIASRTREHNVRYETEDERLLANGCLLRLRHDRQTTLTFKAPPPETDPRFKIYRELEVQVSDFETMDAILNALGFRRRQVYEKWRETWQLDDALVCLDTLPYGFFVEIEAPPDAIMTMVRELELAWERRILATYLGMFATLQDQQGWDFSDVTFENFAAVDFTFAPYRRLFEAGQEVD